MMKKILFILSFLLCAFVSFGQVLPNYTPGFSPRAGKTTVAEDWNLAARANLFCPRYTDTTQANQNVANDTKDTCGRIIYTYDVDGFWVRQCFPVRHWGRVGAGTVITVPTCGLSPGTGIVSYDSLLFFDVTASLYSLCCDKIVRSTHDTTIQLPAADPDNPVFVAIVLGKTGVTTIRGVPAPSPELPQADSCQIILTYVLVNAGQTVPANITQTVIYDENFLGEWPVDVFHNVVGDTANNQFPVHGLVDFFISSYDTADNYIEFASQNGNINLNDYGLLKFYIRSQVTTSFRLSINWWLDGVQQTISLPVNISVTGGAYTTVVLPISYWSFLNTATVNKMRISILTPSTQFPYFDWIQLQKGMTVGSSSGGGNTGVTNLTVDTLNNFAAFPVANPTSNAHVQSNLLNAPANTVWENDSNSTAQPHYGTLNLSNTSLFTGQLNLTNIQTICDGCYLGGQGGTNTAIPFEDDTTFVGNWITFKKNPLDAHQDTFYTGSPFRDSSILLWNTFFGLNGFTATFTQGTNDVFFINSSGIGVGDGVMPTSGSGGTDSAVLRNSATGQYYLAPSGGAITADNGLIMSTPTNVQLGSSSPTGAPLLFDTYVYGHTFTLDFLSISSNPTISIQNQNGVGGTGLDVTSDFATGATIGTSFGNYAAIISATPATLNTIQSVLELNRLAQGTVTNGVGGSLDFYIQHDNGQSDISNRFIWEWTDVTTAVRTSKFILTGTTINSAQDWMTFSGGGLLQLNQYGAGALSTDASGNVTATSDVRLKNIQGLYTAGIDAIMNINPIVYRWNEKSGFDMAHDYIGFSAQNIQSVLGDNAIGVNSQGYLSIQDRALLATLVNAVKEQQREIEYLRSLIKNN